MTNYFPPSPFGTTIIGADQLDLLLHMTLAVSNFSICLLPIGNSSWQLGMVFEIQVQRCLCQLSFLWEETFLWMFHLLQTEKCICSGVHQI